MAPLLHYTLDGIAGWMMGKEREEEEEENGKMCAETHGEQKYSIERKEQEFIGLIPFVMCRFVLLRWSLSFALRAVCCCLYVGRVFVCW